MTPTPNDVERCKAVPLASRLELSTAGFAEGDISSGLLGPVSVDTLWSAFDQLLADNARLRDVARAAEELATQAARDVLDERERQKTIEGWMPEHDDEHTNGELSSAAACYAHYASKPKLETTPIWFPWDRGAWKQKDQRRDLVRAGALILAEIERLDRQAARSSGARGGGE